MAPPTPEYRPDKQDDMASSSSEQQASSMTLAKKSLLDLPSETIALVFENATDHDLAQLCRVSKAIRELAAAELYHNLNHTFTEDPVSPKLSVDYLAGFLETLATSDYNYAGHIKEVFVDTGYAAGKGEQTCRQFGYDLTCGKFLNTLLLATLKRTNSIEGFYWNARIELSSAVYLTLHRMPNLRRVHIRLQSGQSLHSIPKASSGPNQNTTSLNASPISPGIAPPPGPHSPGGYGYAQPAQPSNTFRMVPKIPVAKPVNHPCSFSGFKGLKSLCALDMDTLEYIPEIAACVRDSLDTLKQLELSLSDSLARRAREKPRLDGSDGATSDDASSVASQPLISGDDGAPSGANPEQMRQWHKARQEAILSRIFAPKSPDPTAKEIEAATNEVISRAEVEAKSEQDRDIRNPAKDAEDREFVKIMRAIFREAKSKQESTTSKGSKAIEKIEKAATKYLEGRPKSADETKAKPKIKTLIKIKTTKPPSNSWHTPHQTGSNYSKSYSVHEDVLLDYFGFTKSTWDQMTTQTKNQCIQTYFKESQGVGYQPYPMPPPPPGKSVGYPKVYYANPNSVPSNAPPSKYIVIPPKKVKKPPLPKLKYSSDSDDHGKSTKSAKAGGADTTLVQEPSTSETTKKNGDLSEDPEMLYPSDDEEEGPDQEFETEDELSGNEKELANPEITELKQEINGALKQSGLLEENEEEEEQEASTTVNKGKQAVRDPPNGHLTPPNPPAQNVEVVTERALEDGKEEDAVSKYLRLSHGLPIERLAIYLVPVKPAIFLQHFDAYALKNLTLLNVGSQRRIWASLTKLQRQSPLPLTGIYTDNVTPALLTFVESLEAGQLEDLFLLERYLRKKGRVPQLQDCDKTTIEIDAIRKQILNKHIKGFKRLVIRNDDSEAWAINNSTMRLIGREGAKLRELAVQCDTIIFHTIVRSLPTLPNLSALQINFILEAGTPPVSMTGIAISTQHHYGGGSAIEPHTAASATMLHELRQCVIDSMYHCRETSQLEWMGFSWLGGPRAQSHLDGEGNPYVFLSKVVRVYGREGGGNGEGEGDGSGSGSDSGDERDRGGDESKGKGKAKMVDGVDGHDDAAAAAEEKPKKALPISFWAENDLNISEVQGVKMWDKEIWAGRL